MRAYCLILMAAAWCLCALTAEEEGPFATFLRIKARAAFAGITLRRLILVAGALLIACMAWQLAGFDLALMFGGEVMVYLEIAGVLWLAAARTRLRIR